MTDKPGFEDDHLLVVNKPAGIATHRAGEMSPWGIYELLLNHGPNLSRLGIHQRLDRETSGVLIFSKSAEARCSLSRQFEGRAVLKQYLFVTRGSATASNFEASDPVDGKKAKTRFQFQRRLPNGLYLWKAFPETGRTHQVRLHAAAHELRIVGDDEKNEPLLLHAARLDLQHPVTEKSVVFEAPIPSYFETADIEQRRLQAALALRQGLINEKDTNACRWVHRHADGFPPITVDRFGAWLYVEDFGSPCDHDLSPKTRWHDLLAMLKSNSAIQGIIRSFVSSAGSRQEKQLVAGVSPASEIIIFENKVRYRVDLLRPGSPGLFLDQRENRRHLQSLSHGARILNLFAYTCGFSVAAAAAGACETMNVDLSRNALDRGQMNFLANNLNPASHQFWTGDVFKCLAKLSRRKERFDIVLLDPPSSSRSKASGHFSARRDYFGLVQLAATTVKEGGWLFCSSNLVSWKNDAFLATVENGLKKARRQVVERLWIPQPFDFPATPAHPPYLKSAWLRLE